MTGVQFEQVTKRYPNGFEAVKALDLDVQDGELLVVVGPSGCGKSTTLRMLAGLESVTDGLISIDGHVVNTVAARNRDIAMVFQSYALYPHLNVGGNLAYPLKLAGQTKAEIKERVAKVARQLRLEELLDRKPRQLSGGQRQRVAMGRAMVREPRVFLMDEPLSNLDAKLRVSMRAEIAELQETLGTTMFYVTHDQIEAMTLGTRVAVMNNGVLQQCASPQELYHKPANTFVATFIGAPPMNLLRGHLSVEQGVVVLETGSASCTPCLRPGEQARFVGFDASKALTLGLRPEDVRLVPGGDSSEGLPGRVRLVEVLGAEQIVHVELDGADWFVGDDARGDSGAPRFLAKVTDRTITINAGDAVAVVPDPARLELFDRETNLALAI